MHFLHVVHDGVDGTTGEEVSQDDLCMALKVGVACWCVQNGSGRGVRDDVCWRSCSGYKRFGHRSSEEGGAKSKSESRRGHGDRLECLDEES